MKKHVTILIFIVLLLCLISCLSFVIFSKNKQKTCNSFELDDILYEINLATNQYFISSEEGEDVLPPFPILFDESKKYIFAYASNSKDEYFLLMENMSNDEKERLKKNIETEKNIKLEEYDKYTYVISTTNYTSVIDGIIRSFIYCK